MQNKLTITPSQTIALLSLCIATEAYSYAPSKMADLSGQDTWIAIVVAIMFGMLLLSYYAWLAKKFPTQTLIQYTKTLLGPFVGRVIGALYVLYFMLISSLYICRISVGFQMTFLPHTPVFVLIVMTLTFCVYSALQGYNAVARLGVLAAFLLFGVNNIFLTASVISDINAANYLPFLGSSLGDIGTSSIYYLFPHSQFIFLTMLYPFIQKQRKIGSYITWRTTLVVFVASFLNLATVGLFSARQLAMLHYPPVELSRMVEFGDFFERMDVLFVTFYGAGMFIAIGTVFTVFISSLNQLMERKNGYRGLLLPASVLLLLLSLILFRSEKQMVQFIFGQGIWIAICFQLILPGLLGIVFLIRKERLCNGQNG
ncbi:spore germination protein (amino acid permease) [Paenibacillus taihuensis]|uniref:Spore germination protein (Amino acid permease) n=1 Tax=Paenibacillus taihuensis TaxID=1156355 RepID=A0A3D9RHK1_9BACL|nr:endospore germination permease [Paenibacillus taihuensis]REE77685.1 spore germination protein (amino acid permease) [Paenibacillus taihuensis]